MGRAINFAMVSAFDKPKRLGNNSPNTSVEYVTNKTIMVLLIAKLYADIEGNHFDNISERLAAKASPENKPVRIPIKVMPI